MTLIDEPATNVASEEAATSSHKDPEEWLGVGLVGRHGCHGAVDAQLDTPAVTPTAPPFAPWSPFPTSVLHKAP